MFQKAATRLVILSTIAIAPVVGSAATIVSYEFSSDFSAAEVAPEIIATTFNAGSAIASVTLDSEGEPPQSWSGTNWTTSGDPADALVGNSYAWFRVTPQPGMSVTFTSMTIDVRPHGSGPDDFVVNIVDLSTGFSSQFGGLLSHSDQIKVDAGRKPWETLFATSGDFQDLTGTQEIRIYGFDASQASREVLFDNIQLNGTTSPIPEPAAFPLLALAGVVLGLRRRRDTSSRGIIAGPGHV